jgi:hypothetical protein
MMLKPRLPALIAVGGLCFASLESGCESPGLEAPTGAVNRPSPRHEHGAAMMRPEVAKDESGFLRTIPTSCPADRRYRIPGFSMKCSECHSARVPENEAPVVWAKAKSNACVANLKYIGLAAQTWARNHGGDLPATFSAMAGELRSPLILACPAHIILPKPNTWPVFPPKPHTWPAFSPKEATYQIVWPRRWLSNPVSPYVRCPIHGMVLRADGSVVSPMEGN